jgi:DNA-binding transcriptional regulator YiaG
MKINEWLKKEQLTHSEFLEICSENGMNISHSALAKWCRGHRIPREQEMKTLYISTNGEVTANDFYNLPIAQ